MIPEVSLSKENSVTTNEASSAPPTGNKVTDESEDRIMSIPAVFIDTYAMLGWKNLVRVAVGEEGATTTSGKDYWRFSMILRVEDAKGMAARLLQAAESAEKDDGE